jgi:RNA polymerase sigma-70 factor (ECF subfamily)
MTDEEILAGIGQGGRQRDTAVKALYQAHAQAMLRFFVHQGLPADDAQDILQDTVVKIVRNAHGFRGTGPARAWLWQVARNCLLDHQAARIRQAGCEVAVDAARWDSLADTAPSPLACAIGATAQDCVASGLDAFAQQMPERAHALALQMQGAGIEAIAQQIGRSASATKEYLSQCRKKIQPFVAHCMDLLNP